MKGSEELQWTFVEIAIILIIVSLVANPLYVSADEIVKNDVKYQATEIAGIINILQTSPATTTHVYELPSDDCTITIDNAVTVEMEDSSYSIDLIQPTQIEPTKIECKQGRIEFVKGEKIRVKE